MTTAIRALLIAALTAGAVQARAQSQPADKPGEPAAAPSPRQKTEQENAKTPPPKQEQPSQPTLDELLGLKPDSSAKPEGDQPPPAPDPTRTALDRILTGQEVSEQFEQAVQLMDDTAKRLGDSRDAGIETQRLQDEIIRKLDMLIQSAQNQQRQSRSRSSSSSSSQTSSSQNQPSQPQGQRQSQGQTGDPQSEQMPPDGRDAQPNPDIAARGAAWGSLPERVRDALLQGNADQYSSLYQRWTEAYYRRLAEEANR